MHEANVEPSRLPVHHWHGELDELLRIDRVRIRARGEDSFGRPGAAPVRRTCKPQLGPEKHRRRSLLEAGPGDVEVGPVVIARSGAGGNPTFFGGANHRGPDCLAPGPRPFCEGGVAGGAERQPDYRTVGKASPRKARRQMKKRERWG